MVEIQAVVDAFKVIDIDIYQLRALAPSVDWQAKIIDEGVASVLRDAWWRCNRGDKRVEAFWAFGGCEETLEDILLKLKK